MRSFTIKDPLYGTKLRVVVCPKPKAFTHFAEHYNVHDIDFRSYHGLFFHNDADKYMIWIARWSGSALDHGVLAHEIMHYVFQVTRSVGLKLSSESEEAYTYLFDHIYTKVLDKLKK